MHKVDDSKHGLASKINMRLGGKNENVKTLYKILALALSFNCILFFYCTLVAIDDKLPA